MSHMPSVQKIYDDKSQSHVSTWISGLFLAKILFWEKITDPNFSKTEEGMFLTSFTSFIIVQQRQKKYIDIMGFGAWSGI